MAGNEQRREATASNPRRPNLTVPPRPSSSIFTPGFGLPGFSPGPMTLVSSFFSDDSPDSEFKSFSHLLSGAMSSPRPPNFSSAPPAPAFTMPPGLSPLGGAGGSFLDSPGFAGLFSPQGQYGMTHQQALAQVTTQAQSIPQSRSEYSAPLPVALTTTASMQFPSFTSNSTLDQKIPLMMSDSMVIKESSDIHYADQRSQPASFAVDKPADDGYNWRKYGQKQVKGSEFPRSYYKCTAPNCPVKKKVERSLEGQVTEIIYKGQHNHQPPQSNKRAKDAGSGSSNSQANLGLASQFQSGKMKDGKDQESSQATFENVSVMSDSEEVGDAETAVDDNDEDEPEAKRRNTEVRVTEASSSQRTVVEPRIIVQTTSEVDLLDDGYRWRKYGQKVVKGNPYPRSYYKCTTPGCNVRKHVERAATDPRAVITTYEGKHNHDLPTAKNSSHNMANSGTSQTHPSNTDNHHPSINQRGFANNNEQPVARLRLKEEQIT